MKTPLAIHTAQCFKVRPGGLQMAVFKTAWQPDTEAPAYAPCVGGGEWGERT